MIWSPAGVDTFIFDNTNGFPYTSNILRLMGICQQIRNEGGRTPQVTFLVRENIVDNQALSAAYNAIYKPGVFPDFWFRWQGKPLLLVFDAVDPPSLDLSDEILGFFTIRECWAFSTWAWFGDGQHKWPWIDYYPQGYGWDQDNGVPEAMAVAIGQHVTSNIGRSYSGGVQPPYGQESTDYGLHFVEQWNHALATDPEFIFITGWNEWVAGRFEIGSPAFPGPTYPQLGTTRTIGQSLFVDAYNSEFSRDAEPVKGAHGDNYYYQMIDFIRQFKGVSQTPPPSAPRAITIDGAFDDWAEVTPEYHDQIGDPPARNDHPGFFSAGPYTNLSGRNDIIAAQVTYDSWNVYFHARARNQLSPHSDPGWMVLYIDADNDPYTGWEGFDFVVNRSAPGSQETTLEANIGDEWNWFAVATIDYAAAGADLELAIPRAELGQLPAPVELAFKWTDNVQPAGDVLRFTTHGDAAPNDRFSYRYYSDAAASHPDFDDDRDVDLSDYRHIQQCASGSSISPMWPCRNADLDEDEDVDSNDLTIFLDCLQGPDTPASPQCVN